MSRDTLELFPPTLSYSDQQNILDSYDKSEKNLHTYLASRGYSLEDFRYETGGKKWAGKKAILLKNVVKHDVNIPFVSFFTGCGGVDLGFEATGLKHVAGFEFNELFCKTLRANRPNWKIYGPPTHGGDVSKIDECCNVLANKIKTPFNGIFVGGPPCQPFSIASNQRFSKIGENFKRTGFDHKKNGGLLFDYLEIVRKFRPKAFVVENVPGLRDIDDGEQLDIAVKLMEAAGYTVMPPQILNAADYGVPQNRKRLIIVGHRSRKKFVWPDKHAEAIGCGSVLSLPFAHLPNSETRAHNAGSIARYMRLGYGKRDQLGRVDRLDPTLPSKTVIAGGVSGGGRSHLHPDFPRTLSVRECARLQTFPDNYIFKGPSARQFTQVGNAVPPVLAAELANQLIKLF